MISSPAVDWIEDFRSAASREDLLLRAANLFEARFGFEQVLAFRFLPVRMSFILLNPEKTPDVFPVQASEDEAQSLLEIKSIQGELGARYPGFSALNLRVSDRAFKNAAGLICLFRGGESFSSEKLKPAVHAFEVVWSQLTLKAELRRNSDFNADTLSLSEKAFVDCVQTAKAEAIENQFLIGLSRMDVDLGVSLSRGRLVTVAQVLSEAIRRRIRVFDAFSVTLTRTGLRISLMTKSKTQLGSDLIYAQTIQALLKDLSSLDLPLFQVISEDRLSPKWKASLLRWSPTGYARPHFDDGLHLMADLDAQCDLCSPGEVRVVRATARETEPQLG